MLRNHRTSLATLHICRHNYAVEKGLVLDFCGQPHCGYLPYYPTARFRSPSSYMVSDEPFSDRSCRANLHKWGLAQSPSCDFQDGGCRHFEFSKIRNFNGRSAVGGQLASSCQISSKSVKRLKRYGDLTVFKMAAVRHLGFVGRRLGPPTTTS